MKKAHKPYYDPTPFFNKLEKDLTSHWIFSKPSAKKAKKIRRGVAEMKSGKVKTIFHFPFRIIFLSCYTDFKEEGGSPWPI